MGFEPITSAIQVRWYITKQGNYRLVALKPFTQQQQQQQQ